MYQNVNIHNLSDSHSTTTVMVVGWTNLKLHTENKHIEHISV